MSGTSPHGTAQAIRRVENERVIVTEFRFKPGASTGWHRHSHDYVVVPLLAGKLRPESAEGSAHSQMRRGVAYFRKSGVERDVINANDSDYAFVEIELK